MSRSPPGSTRTDTLCPDTTLCRSESMYFNIYDPEQKVGGWFRGGNRANEGYAEMTVCLYLPDGQVGFMFKRAEIDSNDAFDAGGIRFDVLEPFKRLDRKSTRLNSSH